MIISSYNTKMFFSNSSSSSFFIYVFSSSCLVVHIYREVMGGQRRTKEIKGGF